MQGNVLSQTKKSLIDGWSHSLALWRAPRRIGAIVPSGTPLADAMAREVPDGDGVVIELGGGTGSITQGLLRAGVRESRLVVVERDARLCVGLRRRFPGALVICGDAGRLPELLAEYGVQQAVDAVVSSLPLLAMTPTDREVLLTIALRAVAGLGPVIQYTYGVRCPVPEPLRIKLGMNAQRRSWIWRNLPPASVWRFEVAMDHATVAVS